MDDSRPALSLRAAETVAAVLVIAIMALLYWRFSGSLTPDWNGYARLYDDEGGWLLSEGRDPAFIWFIQYAHHFFGQNGYATFRFTIFSVFTAFAMWLVYAMPIQRGYGPLSAALTALIVLTTFLLKSLVEIREGLAFLFILIPVVAMYGRFRHGMIGTGVGAVSAALVHAGTVLFSVNWLLGAGLFALPDEMLAGRVIQRWLLVLAVLLGGLLAVTLFQNAPAVGLLLQDFGIAGSGEAQGGLWKYLYWIANGAIVLIIRHQVLAAIRGVPKFPYGYASAIVSFAMPLAYSVCVMLVFANFHIPTATSMVIRLLFTSMELGLIITALRGQANLLTAAVAVAMFVDRARLLI